MLYMSSLTENGLFLLGFLKDRKNILENKKRLTDDELSISLFVSGEILTVVSPWFCLHSLRQDRCRDHGRSLRSGGQRVVS